MNSALTCRICDTLAPGDLVELDAILGDPTRWPKTVFGIFDPPRTGTLPASYRRFGAMNMGREWLANHPEYANITEGILRKHLRYDVPVLEVDAAALVERGLVAAADGRSDRSLAGQPIDALAYVAYYNEGIRVGRRGLQLLEQRIDDIVKRKEEVPLALIKMAMDAGLKLSMSQAAIKAAGKRFEGSEEDEDDAFRAAADEQQPSMRVGHHRIRTIDGEARPVVDMGPTDRQRYNEHAAETSTVKIGGQHG